MPVSLEFDISHHYSEAKDGIKVPIALAMGRRAVELVAKLDKLAASGTLFVAGCYSGG